MTDLIIFEAKPASKVALPTSSRQKVIFLDIDGKIKSLDFAGKLEILGGEVTFSKAPESGLFYSAQTQKYYHSVNGELVEVSGEGVEGDPTQVAEIYETTFTLPEGPEGKDGRNGIDGKDGKDGVDGKDGANGTNGKDGTNGTDGVNGKDGRDGIDGKDGTNGIDGRAGVNGKDGKDGLQGPQGIPGKSSGGGISKSAVVKLINEYLPSGEVSKSFGYNSSDELVLLTTIKGTQTFSYTDGVLVSIVGTGEYKSKNFSYDSENKLTGITIL